ncbi:MAG: hypothetical protein FD123_415 [Bacteroidetes bacterium]|nr:MAG: hypothetical protein FD123_415 [Bacteroidota bacterium]
MVEDAPYGSKYKHMYIRCMSCKTLVTTVPYFNTYAALEKIAKKLGTRLD